MSDSTENNELDNYGVWVKKPPKDILPDTDAPDFTEDDFSLESLDTDFADFDTLDNSESTESAVTEETLDDPFAGVDFGDETASSEKAPTEETSEPFTLDDINFDIDEPSAEEIAATDENLEVPAVEETATQPAEEPQIDFEVSDDIQNSIETESVDINLDEMEDGEIDLDNFLSDDSDSSSSSEETVDLSSFGMDDSSNDSVSLDDFLDGGDFSDLNSTGTGTTQKSEEIVDEDPLDIKLSFDETANSFEAEEEAEETQEASEVNGDFVRSTGNDLETESIDLSDFGIDEEDGLHSVKGPEDAIDEIKDESVNYDMKVTVDTDENQSVSMSDVINGTIESEAETESAEPETVETSAPQAPAETDDLTLSAKGQEIISQLMGELASLKSEITTLKTELTELKSQENDIKIEPEQEENTGFFADGGDDDTIALSGDELSNILSSAEFTEETSVEEIPVAEPVIEETTAEEPAFEENIVEETDAEEPAFEESIVEETSAEEPVFETETEEPVSVSNGQFSTTIDSSAFDDSAIFEDTSDDVIIEEPVIEEETVAEEPVIEDSIEEDHPISEDLPEEIEIPKVEDLSTDSDIIVSENSSLTMDTTEIDDKISINPIDEFFEEEPSIESSLTSDKLNYISEDENNPVEIEEPVDEGLGDLDLPSPSLDDMDSEPVFDETPAEEESVIEETILEEPVIENPVEPVASPAVETAGSNGDIPGDLKQEIKSVLSYMDQLLENLPEDKISEFAQSEQFVTYKKLFEELGLS